MACSSSFNVAAAAADYNERNMVVDRNPPPPPPRPLPDGRAVYLHELYREPEAEPRRPHVSRELPFLCRNLAWSVPVFLAISCFVTLVWLIFHPTFPKLNVASATLSTIAVTATAATAECNITFLLTNPSRHLTTIFDRMEIALFYPSQQLVLSHDYQPPLLQPKRSQVTLESNLSFNGVYLGSDVVKAMKEDLDRGIISLGIKVIAVVRYKAGKWKTMSQYMRAYCVGVSFAFSASNKPGLFLNPYQECEVYLYTK